MPDDPSAPQDDENSTLPAAPLRAPSERPAARAQTEGAAPPSSATNFDFRYKQESVLGRGGMGEVRLFRDRVIGREVAMKVIRPDAESSVEQPIVRFLREARVQGQLEHPSIVPVYDMGVDPNGAAYFTMKRVRGMSLEHVLRSLDGEGTSAGRAYSRRRLLTAFSNVCLAVDFAHSRGVLHRDLKPANVMLGDFGEVYLLDWGVAKVDGVADVETKGAQRLDISAAETAGGTILGTPGYIAPEQLRGTSDERSDVYALGAMLFELLAREPLHKGRTVQERLFSTMVPETLRPSVRRPELQIPPELDALCESALATEVNDRLRSARAMSDAIERYLDGDRDLERRRYDATTHAEAAASALERAQRVGGDEAAERAKAMREASTALGLDPQNASALQSFVRLLTEAPKRVPEAATEELQANYRAIQRRASLWGFAALGLFLLMAPVLAMMRVREWGSFVGVFGAIAVAALGNLYTMRSRSKSSAAPLLLIITSNIAVAFASTMLGPLWIGPLVATANNLGLLLASDRSRRWLVVTMSCVSVSVPFALELLHFRAPSYTFYRGSLIVRSHMLELREGPALFSTACCALGVVLITGLVVSRFHEFTMRAQERLLLQAWQLRQIAPEATRAANGAP